MCCVRLSSMIFEPRAECSWTLALGKNKLFEVMFMVSSYLFCSSAVWKCGS